MRSQRAYVNKHQIAKCEYGNASIVWQQYARGGWYPSDVISRDGQLQVITGSGNHFNLKQRHDCLLEARGRISSLKENIAILDTQIWSDAKISEYQQGIADTDWTQFTAEVKAQSERWLAEALESNPKLIALRAELEKQVAHYQARLDLAGGAQ